jgi:hypothetical protein
MQSTCFIIVIASFIGFTQIIYHWKAYQILKLFYFSSFPKFCTFSIFGHYFALHFQTVYPIDANDMALESYRLGATFSC